MYTVEEIANELDISKVTIYSKLRKFPDEVIIKKGKKYITDRLFDVIKDELDSKKEDNPHDIKVSINGSVVEDINEANEISELNQGLIEAVIGQLNEKDMQIKEKDNQIRTLQKLIENSQMILKQEQEKDLKKISMESHFEEFDKKLTEIKEKLDQRRKLEIELKERKENKKLWNKIFK
ncbi:Hypothetical protein CM240_3029 [Clostridium bornimense]|uniref:Uncharacterized protein n=1 Tax=Clostridium bornimense TaxID=1216932 RepID=W6RZQ9_9CLOT|nr:hypothetical protein [Clostridium bornimense]CDM70146.1 Hypothetical protein CM240_3029 [Clostridium bornimense]